MTDDNQGKDVALEAIPLRAPRLSGEDLSPDSVERSRLNREIRAAQRRGLRVTIGHSADAAYADPGLVREVHERLAKSGMAFAKASARSTLGSPRLAHCLEYSSVRALRRLRHVTRSLREALRSTLLYDLPDVDATAWHRQNGRALALGTIVDAHELRTSLHGPGSYSTMSARIGPDVVDHVFAPSPRASANIAGMSLVDACIATSITFRAESAEAARLRAIRDLADLTEFTRTPVTPAFKDIVTSCRDALGIRSRKEEVRNEVARHFRDSGRSSLLMLSIGCGTAQPMLEVISDMKAEGRQAHLILIDQDPIALAVAEELAASMGLEDRVEVHCAKLFIGRGRGVEVMNLQDVLRGRLLDVCEDSGLREYLTDGLYVDLTRQAWNALGQGGLMTTGNMNKNRPQREFLHGLMGWPILVRMRRIKQLAHLHRRAGIPANATRFRVTRDGVYTLCFSTRTYE